MGQDKPKGFVMVMGGGIAGIQAALSLSDAGYGVHLIEHTDTLGGMVPGLHRIYPLCACCKLDPKIAACEQDPNINVMLNTTVENISGDLGNFTVSVKTGSNNDDIKAGAIILAAGIETFDPTVFDTYAYGSLPNVITSVEYEQRQKPLGPDQGIIKRPSDGKTAEKIAWLQCVGSRDINLCDAPYCSSVCCMYALKEAVNTKEFNDDIETTIFYMDMRTHGKGFEDYLNAAIEKDVNLIRSRVHTVDSVPGSDDLAISYADEKGELKLEIFDMVVLSVGLKPSGEAIELAGKTGIDLSEDQFIKTGQFRPVSTNKRGIFVCGGISGPFDIGQSITQAAASVSEIASCLEPETFSPPVEYPKPSKTAGKKPKVFLAYNLCPGMLSDLGTEIEKYAETLPGIVSVSRTEGDILVALVNGLKESGANRLVFASCTPVIHKSLLEEALKLAGLNPYLYETVDLRVFDPQSAHLQLRDRLRMGVSRATLISPPSIRQIPVVKSALIVGGGVSGLESALAIAAEGYKVTLVEKDKKLGGHGRHVRTTWQGYDVQAYLKGLISSAKQDKNITVMIKTTVKENKGFAGKFVTTLDKRGKDKNISHGVAILAPGGDSISPTEYLYGQNKNVYLWSELSAKMIDNPSSVEKADTAVFIQCVGSREPDCTHCSNICCSFAVRTAVDLKTKNPDMNIYILYREMRTFGERERLYREARDKGVVFVRYDLDNKPVVESSDGKDNLKVTVFDPILERSLSFEADFVSLQTAIVGTNNQELAGIFRINLDHDGFFSESPEKLKPVDTSIKGIYMAGLAVYPKDMAENITQAKAASARALEILSQDTVLVGGLVAEVVPEKCAVCCTCVRTCPFNVPVIDHERGAAFIDPGLCQGCGMCVAECPGKAIIMSTCSDEMLIEAPSLLLNIDY
ncbi:MAG: CoB--CoM heterodisulfide reductase iron-sulfur subunit A family protein [Deltaproteobacteria bacterium]|nr:CoB--CoM heterodisulfide reductase iron-sulfur subunit A family protein [Deltaproteobacteria bacterium]